MKKRGQVWVETVIYTMMAFVMIGLVLAYARPKILEFQDKAIIEQTLSMIKDIDLTILTMGGAGNRRLVEIKIKRGEFKIDGIDDRISFEMESTYLYSEPGLTVRDGGVMINTERRGKLYLINLTQEYKDRYNITYEGEDTLKTISKSSLSYMFAISNKGEQKFNVISTCVTNDECSDVYGYTKRCDDLNNMCVYSENRVTIDFKL